MVKRSMKVAFRRHKTEWRMDVVVSGGKLWLSCPFCRNVDYYFIHILLGGAFSPNAITNIYDIEGPIHAKVD